MMSTKRSVHGIVFGLVAGVVIALVLVRAPATVAGAEQMLPPHFKVGARVQVLGWNGTFEIAEIQGQWLRGTLGRDQTIWLYAPAAQGFVFDARPQSAK